MVLSLPLISYISFPFHSSPFPQGYPSANLNPQFIRILSCVILCIYKKAPQNPGALSYWSVHDRTFFQKKITERIQSILI